MSINNHNAGGGGEPCDGLASHQRGCSHILSHFTQQKPELSTGLMGLLAWMQTTYYFFTMFRCCTILWCNYGNWWAYQGCAGCWERSTCCCWYFGLLLWKPSHPRCSITSKNVQVHNKTKLVKYFKRTIPHERTVCSFQLNGYRSTDSKVRTTLYGIINSTVYMYCTTGKHRSLTIAFI